MQGLKAHGVGSSFEMKAVEELRGVAERTCIESEFASLDPMNRVELLFGRVSLREIHCIFW